MGRTVKPLPQNVETPPSTGAPLPKDFQGKMENAFSADFSAVRVHQGPQPASIGAKSFAHGNDIFLAPGTSPATPAGQKLLAHELTHIVQQRAGRLQVPKGTVLVEDPALEKEADALGAKALAGQKVSVPGYVPKG